MFMFKKREPMSHEDYGTLVKWVGQENALMLVALRLGYGWHACQVAARFLTDEKLEND